MTEWNIQSRAHACQACTQPFMDKQPYFTLLFAHRQELERLDVCAGCWEAQYSQGASDRKGYVSFWQGVFNLPPAVQVEPIQRESAESLLRQMADRQDPSYAPAVFILAVMLERKRVLKAKAQTIEDGHRTLVYEHVKTGELLTISDPDLKLAQLEAVQRQVAQLLEQGLPPAPTVAGPAEETAPPVTEPPPGAGEAVGPTPESAGPELSPADPPADPPVAPTGSDPSCKA